MVFNFSCKYTDYFINYQIYKEKVTIYHWSQARVIYFFRNSQIYFS